jgi:hypothetical protein
MHSETDSVRVVQKEEKEIKKIHQDCTFTMTIYKKTK